MNTFDNLYPIVSVNLSLATEKLLTFKDRVKFQENHNNYFQNNIWTAEWQISNEKQNHRMQDPVVQNNIFHQLDLGVVSFS
jgi:hypothetical protein